MNKYLKINSLDKKEVLFNVYKRYLITTYQNCIVITGTFLSNPSTGEIDVTIWCNMSKQEIEDQIQELKHNNQFNKKLNDLINE